MKTTAKANSNIALIKYWGKRNKELILPHNSSISMTLDKLHTTTTVEFDEKIKEDTVKIDGKTIEGEEKERVVNHLNLIRKLGKKELKAKVESENNFPKAAGLASSASAFAALTMAATKALDLHMEKRDLSIIARQGSGSASRSIEGGYCEWLKGSSENGLDSYAKQIAPKDHWPELRMIVNVLTPKEKKIKSRAGMSQTVKTSPFYKAWLETINEDLEKAREAIKEKKFTQLGRTAEMNALKMHSTMLTTDPHIIYFEPETITLMKEVMQVREEGIECYFTMDGGPQVKILALKKDANKIRKKMEELKETEKTIMCEAGDGTKLIDRNLF